MELFAIKASEKFTEWLEEQHGEMTKQAFADKVGFTRGHIYKVIHRQKAVTPHFCYKVAAALEMKPVEVMEIAGFPDLTVVPEQPEQIAQ